MYLGDNLLQGGIEDLVEAFEANAPDALILLTPVPDPEHYGVAELDGDRVVALAEKPPEPKTNLALVGVYLFAPVIHDAARAIEPSARGELEITDAIQHLVDTGKRVEPHIVQGWWKDTGRLEDMLEANRLILDTIEQRIDGELIDSQVEGRVDRRGRARGSSARRCAGRRSSARTRSWSTATSARTPPSARAASSTAPRSSTRSCWPTATVHELNGRLESSLLGRNVRSVARRRPAEGLPPHGRRQLRDRDPVRLLVTGAAGMLGHEVVAAAARLGHEVAALGPRRSAT